MKILFATSELFPLIKTGGLADVSRSLTTALQREGMEVDLILPAYRSVWAKLPDPVAVYHFTDAFLPPGVMLLEHHLPDTGQRLLLVHCPSLFDRDGGPYGDDQGHDWGDNAQRFAVFCRAIVALLAGRCQLAAGYSLVHCNDWQAGLVPALLKHEGLPVGSLLTIHNLAYQGNFSRTAFETLMLPAHWWAYDKLEFYGRFSFLKAGIVFADRITTVSPTYGREILQEPLGCGMSGLLQYHQNKLCGILNGADYDIWNPASDPLIRFPYDADSLAGKVLNKLDLQRSLGLTPDVHIPLVGLVSRLVHQKGVDWIAEVMASMRTENLQWVILGSGDKTLEDRLLALATDHPASISVTIGYDETLAHRIEAGSDLFAMPSRYEPCGLNQIYSLRYGTLPVVRATGGLVDTVTDTTPATLRDGSATGFSYHGDSARELEQCVRRALSYFPQSTVWETLQRTAMAQRFDWKLSAQHYIQLYRETV